MIRVRHVMLSEVVTMELKLDSTGARLLAEMVGTSNLIKDLIDFEVFTEMLKVAADHVDLGDPI